jgi:hypothetical protein
MVCLLEFNEYVIFSTTSITSSNASIIHFPFFVVVILLTDGGVFLTCDGNRLGTFFPCPMLLSPTCLF